MQQCIDMSTNKKTAARHGHGVPHRADAACVPLPLRLLSQPAPSVARAPLACFAQFSVPLALRPSWRLPLASPTASPTRLPSIVLLPLSLLLPLVPLSLS